jgi:hypothetical protein
LIRNSDVYQVFVSGQLVHQETFDAQNAALGAAALERAKTIHRNIMSLSLENRELLMDKLFMQLHQQPGSQTVTLPWSALWTYVDFPQEAPSKQPMGPAQGAPQSSSTPPVPEMFADTLASTTASVPKMESDADSPLSSLKSSTSKTPPTNVSKSHQTGDGSTKRKRDGSTSTKTATDTSASDTKNARDAWQSSTKRRKLASKSQSARHRRILRQLWHPLNPYDIHGGHIGDEWEEFLFEGEKRLVGWQWLNGYARRVIKTPFTKFGVFWLSRKEELALEKAGLRLDHEYGIGDEVVEEEA